VLVDDEACGRDGETVAVLAQASADAQSRAAGEGRRAAHPGVERGGCRTPGVGERFEPLAHAWTLGVGVELRAARLGRGLRGRPAGGRPRQAVHVCRAADHQQVRVRHEVGRRRADRDDVDAIVCPQSLGDRGCDRAGVAVHGFEDHQRAHLTLPSRGAV
jgi:hypothetical protein